MGGEGFWLPAPTRRNGKSVSATIAATTTTSGVSHLVRAKDHSSSRSLRQKMCGSWREAGRCKSLDTSSYKSVGSIHTVWLVKFQHRSHQSHGTTSETKLLSTRPARIVDRMRTRERNFGVLVRSKHSIAPLRWEFIRPLSLQYRVAWQWCTSSRWSDAGPVYPVNQSQQEERERGTTKSVRVSVRVCIGCPMWSCVRQSMYCAYVYFIARTCMYVLRVRGSCEKVL